MPPVGRRVGTYIDKGSIVQSLLQRRQSGNVGIKIPYYQNGSIWLGRGVGDDVS